MDSNLTKITEGLNRLNEDSSYSTYVAVANALNGVRPEETPWPILKIAVLRNFTVEPLLAILKGEVLRMGFFPQLYVADYDTTMNEVMSTDSGLYQFKADVIVLAQWLEGIAPSLIQRFASFSPEKVNAEKERILSVITNQITNIRKNSQASILINNFPLPYPSGSSALTSPSESQINTLRLLNQELEAQIKSFQNIFCVDYAYVMSHVGYAQGFDERYWQAGKSPFSRHALLPIVKEYVRYVRALTGKTHKCLIVDCDNTLWGGIVGEDGLDGIKLGPEYPGSCYMAFQNELLNLHDRGIILAVCSKNNEEDVLEVLERHPYAVLKKEHLAAWRINWEDKVKNIRAIVAELNIGLDSVVFADDNAYEIGLVKHQIPEITTIQLSAEPAQMRAQLLHQGYFDVLSVSAEDKRRTQMYKEESQRKTIAAQTGCVEDYLKELEIQIEIGNPQNFHIPRVAQLTQKTNQFNLTTRRYTEDDIRRFSAQENIDVWYLQLQDKIADMGIVGVAIVRYDGIVAEIDSFLLSCRALGRGVEDAFIHYVIESAQAKGISVLRGDYLPTAKNKQVANFYQKYGFLNTPQNGDAARWELMLKKFTGKAPEWIKVKSPARSAV